MKLDLLRRLNAAREGRQAAILVTDPATGEARIVVEAEGYANDPIRDELAARFRSGVSGMVEAGGRNLFLTVELPPPRLVVIGAVHISQALAPMAKLAGFDVTIIDPRTAFATPERFPDVTLLAEWPDDAIPKIGLDEFTAVAALTHDPKIDDGALIAALSAGSFYIGALGSRKTHGRRLDRLRCCRGERGGAFDHPRADRGPDRRAVAGRDRGGDPRRGDRGAPEPRHEGERGGGVKFGPVAVADAEGAILAHSVRHAGGVLKKGTVLIAADVAALTEANVATVVAARLEPSDVHEDEAAVRLARALAGNGVRVERPFTGRSNLYAERAGVLVVNRQRIHQLNRIDPAITIATLPEYAVAEAGRMIATVKIIPFAVDGASLIAAEGFAGGAIRIAPFRPLKVGLVATSLPSLKPSVMDKTRRLLEERLAPAGARLVREIRVAHDAAAVAPALAALKAEGCDLLIAFGASATVDEGDVVPGAIVAAGGRVVHFGMPVDPGNLLVLGDLGGRPVIGAPGCARSPKENGFDWVLYRLLAGLDVTTEDLTALGVGGLLMEIVSRPQPREGGDPVAEENGAPRVAAIVLAAGQGRRMGGPNKLAATIRGRPLVRIAAEAAVASRATPVVVVTGHEPEKVRAALDGLDVSFVHNPDHADGLSTSLRRGIAALPDDVDGAVVLLADMPGVDATVVDRLISAFDPASGTLIVCRPPTASAATRCCGRGSCSRTSPRSPAIPADAI